jgi:hypothetical protein
MSKKGGREGDSIDGLELELVVERKEKHGRVLPIAMKALGRRVTKMTILGLV